MSVLRFSLTFLLLFALLEGGFEASRGTRFENFVVQVLILEPTVAVVNTITPQEHAQLKGRTLFSRSGSRLNVIRGCEGIEMFLLLAAAILAYPTTAKDRAQGLLFGCALAYALSIARLMALFYILEYSPTAWQTLHGLFLPLAPILLMAVYFMKWSALNSAGPPRLSESRAS